MSVLATAALANAGTALTANQALSSLLSGNSPFLAGNFANLSKMAQPGIRQGLAAGQSPYAIVLGCSDSRVTPEVIFDKGLGEVFTVRVAGNIVADHEIGSIEYGVEHLCSPLIVVMGHTKCGAVTAAVNYAYPLLSTSTVRPIPLSTAVANGSINSLINTLLPAVTAAYDANPAAYLTAASLIDPAIVQNVKMTAADLITKSTIIDEAVNIGMPATCLTTGGGSLPVGTKAKIVGAKYHVDHNTATPAASLNGKVELISLVP